MINFFTQPFPPELKNYYDSVISVLNPFDPTNTGQGTTTVDINARSGVAIFSQSIPANGYQTFVINNTLVDRSDIKIRCDLFYDGITNSNLGKPAIVFVDAFEGSQYFAVEVKNESTTDATNGSITITFQFLN